MNTDKCPTCNAPAKMTWSGLDLVAESGDETLASKHYEYQPNGNNTLLAVSGPEAYRSMVESIIVPQGYKTIHIGHAAQVSAAQFLYKKQVDQLITELSEAACATAKGEERKE